MMNNSKLLQHIQTAKGALGQVGKAAVALIAGATLLAGNVGKTIKSTAGAVKVTAEEFKEFKKQKNKNEGAFVMKKSTAVAILVFLAAVAGALGALYMYVLRREKELDEYEQLLFSEDFDDDFSDDFDADAADVDMDVVDTEVSVEE